MKKKKTITLLMLSILCLQALYFISLPTVKAVGEIPIEYSQEIDLDGIYVYNVTEFGANSNWLNFSGQSEGDWSTNAGGQIIVNFTGFYDRDPNDITGDVFPDTNMSWLDVEIYKNITGSLQLNFTRVNVSNSEVARALNLMYNEFVSGFLIPINNYSIIIGDAEAESAGGVVTVEESYNFVSIKYSEIGGDKKTWLVYDRTTGILTRAMTEILSSSYKLEIFLLNYSLDFETEYEYDIIEFGPPGYGFWNNLMFVYRDTYALREGSWIKVNFTGYYGQDPTMFDPTYDTFQYITDRAWHDIKCVYNGDFGPITTMTLNNISVTEAAVSLTINLGPFGSGFLLEGVNNKSFDVIGAAQTGASSIFNSLTVTETDLTYRFDSKYTTSSFVPQETQMIYEKFTGLLLWANTSVTNYHLQLVIDGYSAPEASSDQVPPDGTPDQPILEIFSFPLMIILGIISLMSLILSIRLKKRNN